MPRLALHSKLRGRLLPDTWLTRFAPLATAGDPQADGTLRFTRPQAALLDALLSDRTADAQLAVDAGYTRMREQLALSGTPVENHLGELWSLFEFLNPGLLGRSTTFQRALAQGKNDESTEVLSRALRPFLPRRTKQQVAPELPARTEQMLTCVLSKPERSMYDGLRRHYRNALLGRVDKVGIGKSQVQILEALLRLRQAACHPGLIDPAKSGDPSAKFEVLLEHMRAVIDERHKALVFSQFTSLLGLLKPVLDREAVTYEYLDGATRDRAERSRDSRTTRRALFFWCLSRPEAWAST